MPPVKKPAKPGKPNEPKKPSSRSKTKNAECSQAASTWQLSLRGKATATAETYQTLAKCRALASSQRKADSYGRTGKLSEQGKTALESRLQSRFESGLITDKSRKAKLADLLAKRKAAQQRRNDGATAAQKYSLNGRFAEGRGTAERFLAAKFLKETRSDLATAQKKISELGKEPRKPSSENQFFGSGGRQNASPEVVSAYDSSQRMYSAWRRKYSEAKKKEVTASNILFHAVRRKKESRLTASKPQPAPTPPKYSLGGQLAPGRGTKYRTQAAKDLAGIRDAARKGDMKKVADLAERSLDMKVIPSKFDETKVAAIGRYRGARWESMTVSQLRKKMTEGEKTYAWMASQKKR